MNKEEMQELEKGSGIMNKISFIIEFDEVSKIQDEQLTEFIEKTGIKFKVLESDNDLKKYKKYKEVMDKTIKDLDSFSFKNKPYYIPLNKYQDYQELLEILRGGINGKNRSTKR